MRFILLLFFNLPSLRLSVNSQADQHRDRCILLVACISKEASLLTKQASGLPFDQANLSLVCWKFILTKIREKNENVSSLHIFFYFVQLFL